MLACRRDPSKARRPLPRAAPHTAPPLRVQGYRIALMAVSFATMAVLALATLLRAFERPGRIQRDELDEIEAQVGTRLAATMPGVLCQVLAITLFCLPSDAYGTSHRMPALLAHQLQAAVMPRAPHPNPPPTHTSTPTGARRQGHRRVAAAVRAGRVPRVGQHRRRPSGLLARGAGQVGPGGPTGHPWEPGQREDRVPLVGHARLQATQRALVPGPPRPERMRDNWEEEQGLCSCP